MESYIIAFSGALAHEALHWYNLRKELDSTKKIIQSKQYWIITIISLLVFTIATQHIYEFILPKSEISEKSRVFITALFFPTIVKSLLKVVIKSLIPTQSVETPNRREIIGENKVNGKFTIFTYFK